MAETIGTVLGFLDGTARARATSVLPVPGGIAVLNADFPLSHDLNRLIVSTPCDPAELVAAADEVLGGAGLEHRKIDVMDAALGRDLAAGLAGHGYTSSPEVVMAATGPDTKGPPTAEVIGLGVAELEVGERAAVASLGWRQEQPTWDEATIDQLGRRIATITPPTRATFFAVRDRPGGRVICRADLYQRDGVAQIEEVMTEPEHQGRGLASRLVRHALARARAEADLVFLIADAEDWPQQLYRRLGFTEIGQTLIFRTPGD